MEIKNKPIEFVNKTPIREIEQQEDLKMDLEGTEVSLKEERAVDDLNSSIISTEYEISEEEQALRKETRLRHKKRCKNAVAESNQTNTK